MDKERKKNNRGGRRVGAGRPKSTDPTKLYTFRVGGEIARCLDARENRSEFIKNAIKRSLIDEKRIPDFSQIGTAYLATKVKEKMVSFFDIGIVAGFPIPLDNDERAQSIELLHMLCPYPESSYLIRVEGNSMIDANIHSGDIVIVDKSNRNPNENEVAVCELNGEYTLKRFVKHDDKAWLVPANPDYSEIEITPDDSFIIWGTVTYIIHKPV